MLAVKPWCVSRIHSVLFNGVSAAAIASKSFISRQSSELEQQFTLRHQGWRSYSLLLPFPAGASAIALTHSSHRSGKFRISGQSESCRFYSPNSAFCYCFHRSFSTSQLQPQPRKMCDCSKKRVCIVGSGNW